MTKQPKTAPARALNAAQTRISFSFAAILRGTSKAIAAFAAVVLMMTGVTAQAAVVNVSFTDLGGSQYLADIAVENDGSPASISGFTLYFDEARFTNLALTASPAAWDSLLIQPDLGLPAAGFLDSFVIDPLTALSLGQTQRGFQVSFDYIGLGLPGSMAFDITDSDFNVLFSGVTTTVTSTPPGGQIPEPDALWLALVALGCLVVVRIKKATRRQTLSLIAGCIGLGAAIGVQAAPRIEGVDLVSSTRVDRTKFDYKFAIRVRGDSKNYDAGSFTASINAPGSTLLSNAINVGQIDSGGFSRPTDTITVRHDRQFPFDRTKLLFSFAGKVSASSNPAMGPTVGMVNFYEFGGRPGHEGGFPIRTENPIAGKTLRLQAAVFGDVNVAEYSIHDTAGTLLATGNLPRAWVDMPWFAVDVIIPSTNFTIEVKATGTDGKRNTWRSKPYTPQTFTARLEPASGIFNYGQVIQAKIIGTSTTASGEYIVSLVRPGEFPGDIGPWTVTITPGQSFVILTQISAPPTGPSNSFHTLGVSYSPKLSPQNAQYSNLQFFAK